MTSAPDHLVGRAAAVLRALSHGHGATTTEISRAAGLARPPRTACSRRWATRGSWTATSAPASGTSARSCTCSARSRRSATT
ncbi:helix-turn-helix domain-containing protein [Amycolatopsis sp. NPDC004368]